MNETEYLVFARAFGEELLEAEEKQIKTQLISTIRSIAGKCGNNVKEVIKYIGEENCKKFAALDLSECFRLKDKDVELIIYEGAKKELSLCTSQNSRQNVYIEYFPTLEKYILDKNHVVNLSTDLSLQKYSSLLDNITVAHTVSLDEFKEFFKNNEIFLREYTQKFILELEKEIEEVLMYIKKGLSDEQIYDKEDEEEYTDEESNVVVKNRPKL